MIITKEIRTLYLLSLEKGKANASTLEKAAKQLGFDCQLERRERGFSRSGGKLPDEIWIEWNGESYGVNCKNKYFEKNTLVEFARDVFNLLSDETQNAIMIDYHICSLEKLGVDVSLIKNKGEK